MSQAPIPKCLWPGSEKSETGTQVTAVETTIEVCDLNLNEHQEKMVVALHNLNLKTTHFGSL